MQFFFFEIHIWWQSFKIDKLSLIHVESFTLKSDFMKNVPATTSLLEGIADVGGALMDTQLVQACDFSQAVDTKQKY